MKYVLLAIFVLLAAQPVPASACATCDGQGSGISQHADGHDHATQGGDCCDQLPGVSDDGCAGFNHCGACAAGIAAGSPPAVSVSFYPGPALYPGAGQAAPGGTAAPPFRPPAG